MWRLALPLLLTACSPVDQESLRTVAAIEVPLHSQADWRDLLAILRRHAAAFSLHVDDASAQLRASESQSKQVAPEDQSTFYIGLWRVDDDEEAEVIADDMS